MVRGKRAGGKQQHTSPRLTEALSTDLLPPHLCTMTKASTYINTAIPPPPTTTTITTTENWRLTRESSVWYSTNPIASRYQITDRIIKMAQRSTMLVFVAEPFGLTRELLFWLAHHKSRDCGSSCPEARKTLQV